MDATIFKKMKAKPPCTSMAFYTPSGYPKTEEYHWIDSGQADFVHVFVESRAQFTERFPQAAAACREDSLLWVSYPKSNGKKTYDINRDSLWSLLLPTGFHPLSQVALDEEWSALRVKRNEPGALYEPPANVKINRSK